MRGAFFLASTGILHFPEELFAESAECELYLRCSRRARPLPRGFTGHVVHPIRSIADFGEREEENQ
jgi:hypothetical protein